MTLNCDLTLKYLGHSTFLLTTPAGKRVLFEAWVQSNPACPHEAQSLDSLDLMLITHAHSDHLQDAVEIAKSHQPRIVCIVELAGWLESQGVKYLLPMNKGGSQVIDDIRVTMVHAIHSSGIAGREGRMIYGGEPAGFVVELENGFRIYHAGDTSVFGDMKIIGELYRPDLALLPIGDHFTMGPEEAAYACRLLGVTKVVPMHFGTFPLLTGTPEKFMNLTRDLGVEVLALRPGESLS